MPKLNRAKDEKNLVDRELTHVPQVKLVEDGDGWNVTVNVGKNPHAMEIVHFIEYVEIFDDETFLARHDFTADNKPIAVFYLKQKPAKLVAKERCNTHGEWVNS